MEIMEEIKEGQLFMCDLLWEKRTQSVLVRKYKKKNRVIKEEEQIPNSKYETLTYLHNLLQLF